MTWQSSLITRYSLVMPTARPAIPGEAPQTVAAVLEAGVHEHPARPALVGRHARYSYTELDREAARAAAALWKLGVRPGDRVAACMGNHPDIVILFLGCMRIGAIWVGINRPLAPPEKAYMLADAAACLFVGERATCEQVRARQHEIPSLRSVLEIDPGNDDCEWNRVLRQSIEAAPHVDIDPFAPAAIAYTSGTTGFPKGAVHSQHNLLIPGAVAAATGVYPHGQVQGVLLPLTILNLMVLVPLLTFQIRGTCVCMDRIDAVGVAEWVRSEKIGHFAAVPAVYHDLLTHPEVRDEDLATLVRPEVGGAECPPAFLRLYRERFGADVAIGYGMTEAPTAVTRSLGDKPPTPGLIGRAVPQVEIRILDADGKPVIAGEVGEICVAPASSGPFSGVYTPMLGYWGKPEETAKALRGGILHTGDLGATGEDGNYYIRGRRNELILRGGANVYPAEIERVVHRDARVAACAVLGVPDERLGERVVAAIQLAEGAIVSEDELRQHCIAELARYKIPERFYFVESLPRNSMGKIVKHQLRAQLGLG
ncbi:MAG TPA: AMP-binding protein [Candidatus Binatia bacterium]|nr:AMP-binding protein [Candidatus Binatia bacterium]